MARLYRPQKKQPDGSTWQSPKFYGQFTDYRGKARRIPLSTNKKDAKKLLDELLAQDTRRRNGLELPKATSPKVDKLRGDFLKAMKVHLRSATLHDYTRDLRHLFEGSTKRGPWLPSIDRISDLSPKIITRFQQKALKEGLAPRTANRILAALSSMMSWAVQQEHIDSNPIVGIRHLSPSVGELQRQTSSPQELSMGLSEDASASGAGQRSCDNERSHRSWKSQRDK